MCCTSMCIYGHKCRHGHGLPLRWSRSSPFFVFSPPHKLKCICNACKHGRAGTEATFYYGSFLFTCNFNEWTFWEVCKKRPLSFTVQPLHSEFTLVYLLLDTVHTYMYIQIHHHSIHVVCINHFVLSVWVHMLQSTAAGHTWLYMQQQWHTVVAARVEPSQ